MHPQALGFIISGNHAWIVHRVGYYMHEKWGMGNGDWELGDKDGRAIDLFAVHTGPLLLYQ